MIDAREPIAETAQSHLETLVPTAGPDDPVGHAIALLSSRHHAIADSIYIVDAEHCLLGLVPVAALLTTARDVPLRSLMRPAPPVSIPTLTRSMWPRSPTITV
jgi:Mg/Co/Ni transporter MgtE